MCSGGAYAKDATDIYNELERELINQPEADATSSTRTIHRIRRVGSLGNRLHWGRRSAVTKHHLCFE